MSVLVEPSGPNMKTSIPGPKSLKHLKRLNSIQNTDAVQLFIDYDRSYGNYIIDADGNAILDANSHIASLTLGYNHPSFVKALRDPRNQTHFINRPALGNFPSLDWADRLENSLMSVAPKGMHNVTTMGCGSTANEHAFKAIFMAYMRKQRNDKPFTEEELSSCVYNKRPGCPPLTLLSFKKAFHGRTMASLALSHAKAVHKLDFPSVDWPSVDFPQLKYPLEGNQSHNAEQERISLMQVKQKIEEYKVKGTPVAGVVVEPIQAEGGDNYASNEYFRKLQKICKETGTYMLVDEVQTGGGTTGTMWYHENWQLDSPPDVVVFSKKMLTGGFYCTQELRPKEAYRIFSTWMGDPAKVILLEAMLETIRNEDLLRKTARNGQILLQGLRELEAKYPEQLSSSRGVGMFAAVDVKDTKHRDLLLSQLLQNGVLATPNGVRTMRLRPALIFEEKHVEVFLEILDRVLHIGK